MSKINMANNAPKSAPITAITMLLVVINGVFELEADDGWDVLVFCEEEEVAIIMRGTVAPFPVPNRELEVNSGWDVFGICGEEGGGVIVGRTALPIGDCDPGSGSGVMILDREVVGVGTFAERAAGSGGKAVMPDIVNWADPVVDKLITVTLCEAIVRFSWKKITPQPDPLSSGADNRWTWLSRITSRGADKVSTKP